MAAEEDGRSLEELQREKLMLEIEKLRRDMMAQDRVLRMEGWKLALAFLAGGAGFLAAVLAVARLMA